MYDDELGQKSSVGARASARAIKVVLRLVLAGKKERPTSLSVVFSPNSSRKKYRTCQRHS